MKSNFQNSSLYIQMADLCPHSVPCQDEIVMTICLHSAVQFSVRCLFLTNTERQSESKRIFLMRYAQHLLVCRNISRGPSNREIDRKTPWFNTDGEAAFSETTSCKITRAERSFFLQACRQRKTYLHSFRQTFFSSSFLIQIHATKWQKNPYQK